MQLGKKDFVLALSAANLALTGLLHSEKGSDRDIDYAKIHKISKTKVKVAHQQKCITLSLDFVT